MKSRILSAAALLFGLAFASSAHATVMGSLALCGDSLSVNATGVTWSGGLHTCAGTALSYSGGTLEPGATGAIKSVTFGGGSLDQFMTFTGTTLNFELTSFGPMNLLASGPNVLLSLGAVGTTTDAGVTSSWTGSFQSQINNQTVDSIRAVLAAQGSITASYTGDFTVTPQVATAPEPATLWLLGLGLAGVGYVRRRRII